MDKQNVFCSNLFHMDSDDVLHILIKDLVDVLPDIELYDKEGNVEDSLYANVEYGALYNWYATTDARNIANTGWHSATTVNYQTLITYLGGTFVSGGKLKETGTVYWLTPNTGATNEVGFNARGTGLRNGSTGLFVSKPGICLFHVSDTYGVSDTCAFILRYDNTNFQLTTPGGTIPGLEIAKRNGYIIRLIKDSTTLIHGQTGSYMGNDGKVYNSICIGTQEWLSENLKETKYRDGTDIPVVSDNAAWVALATGAMCYYNNDITYA